MIRMGKSIRHKWVKVATRPPSGKGLFTQFTVHTLGNLSIQLGFEGRILVLTVSVPGYCLSFTLNYASNRKTLRSVICTLCIDLSIPELTTLPYFAMSCTENV